MPPGLLELGLQRTGAREQAMEQYREVVRRVDLVGSNYRRDQRPWYDAARRAGT